MWCAVNGHQNRIASDGIIYYMNGQSIEALAFRVVSSHLVPCGRSLEVCTTVCRTSLDII